MSYAVTDAVESDMIKQISKLREILSEIDQLASEARDCDDIAPKLPGILQVALVAAENALCEATGQFSCGHARLVTKCACCAFLSEQGRHAAHVLKEVA